ncbi:MAG: four helix bundle protein, partial [Leadbetterella sp.]
MRNYKDLDVWKFGRELVVEIYKMTKHFPQDEKFGLVSQMRRCAISIPSNIAEGQGRNHTKDSVQYYYISRGSLYELETQVIISNDLEYTSQSEFERISQKITECLKLTNGLINYFETLIK